MYHTLLGVDEVGRGPLAGPVAVGVVAVPHDFDIAREIPGVGDSKALSEKKRAAVYEQALHFVRTGILQYRIEFQTAHDIDERGIVPSIRTCMERGITALAPAPSGIKIYLDGGLAAPKQYEQETIIRGDATVPIIGLASIMAKVERDRLMETLHIEYPQYGFAGHKGYGTKAHINAIKEFGLSDIHRRSFCSAFI